MTRCGGSSRGALRSPGSGRLAGVHEFCGLDAIHTFPLERALRYEVVHCRTREAVVLAVRALRGVAVGRKNHYGSRSERGTRTAALFPGRSWTSRSTWSRQDADRPRSRRRGLMLASRTDRGQGPRAGFRQIEARLHHAGSSKTSAGGVPEVLASPAGFRWPSSSCSFFSSSCTRRRRCIFSSGGVTPLGGKCANTSRTDFANCAWVK